MEILQIFGLYFLSPFGPKPSTLNPQSHILFSNIIDSSSSRFLCVKFQAVVILKEFVIFLWLNFCAMIKKLQSVIVAQHSHH